LVIDYEIEDGSAWKIFANRRFFAAMNGRSHRRLAGLVRLELAQTRRTPEMETPIEEPCGTKRTARAAG
jgi:hypothetical protein